MSTEINSVEIPSEFVDVASRWYDGMGDMLYAVCSTGGLTTGTICPVTDYTDKADRDIKWYYSLWLELSGDVGRAERSAYRAVTVHSDGDDGDENEYFELLNDHDTLRRFEEFADSIVERLENEYPELEDWSGA